MLGSLAPQVACQEADRVLTRCEASSGWALTQTRQQGVWCRQAIEAACQIAVVLEARQVQGGTTRRLDRHAAGRVHERRRTTLADEEARDAEGVAAVFPHPVALERLGARRSLEVRGERDGFAHEQPLVVPQFAQR